MNKYKKPDPIKTKCIEQAMGCLCSFFRDGDAYRAYESLKYIAVDQYKLPREQQLDEELIFDEECEVPGIWWIQQWGALKVESPAELLEYVEDLAYAFEKHMSDIFNAIDEGINNMENKGLITVRNKEVVHAKNMYRSGLGYDDNKKLYIVSYGPMLMLLSGEMDVVRYHNEGPKMFTSHEEAEQAIDEFLADKGDVFDTDLFVIEPVTANV